MKRKECFWWVFAIIGVCLLSIRCSNVKEDYCCYVNPFIGNADNGHTFPGACVPFGMIQVSPESGMVRGDIAPALILRMTLSWDFPKII